MKKTARRFQAILFDIDGTLLDTTELLFQAFEHTLDAHKLPVHNRDVIGALIGKHIVKIYTNLAPGIDPQILIDTHSGFQKNNLHLAIIFPNTQKVLETLKKAGIKLGVISNRIRTSRPSLKRAGIFDYFDTIVTAGEVTHPKPHPEMIEKALAHLHVKPEKALIVGDTESDILTGKNAGVTTIAVTYGFHGKKVTETNPDFVVDDIFDILPIVLGK